MTKILIPAVSLADNSSELFEITASSRSDERTKKARLLLKDSAYPTYTDVIKSKFIKLSHNINFSNVSQNSEMIFDTFTEQTFSARLGIYVCLEQFIFNRKFRNDWDAVIITGNLNLENINLREIDKVKEKYNSVLEFSKKNCGKYLFIYVSDTEIDLEKNESIEIRRFSSNNTVNEINSCLFTMDVKYYADYVDKWGLYEGINELSSEEILHKNFHYTFYRENNLLKKVVKENSQGKIFGNSVDFLYSSEGKLLSRVVKNRSLEVMYTEEIKKNFSRINFYSKAESASSFIHDEPLQELIGDSHDFVRPNIKSLTVERDSNGFITKEFFHRFHNDNACYIVDDSYGHYYKRDELGRIIYQTELDIHGEINEFKTILEFKYDEKGNETERKTIMKEYSFIEVVRFRYDSFGNLLAGICLNERGEKKNFHNSTYCEQDFEYDSNVCIISESFRDVENNLVNCESGYAKKNYRYGDDGKSLEVSFFDSENKPAGQTFEPNISKYKYVLNEHWKILQESYFDMEGKPVKSSMGVYCAKINYSEQEIIFDYCDLNGQLMMNRDGYARKVLYLNEDGYITEQVYFDKNDILCADSNGFAWYVFNRNENGNISQYIFKNIYLDEVVCIDVEYDEYERVVKKAFSRAGELFRNDFNYSIVRYFYDDDGNNINEVDYLDEKEELIDTKMGYAAARYNNDEDDYQFFNSLKEPVNISKENYENFISEISKLSY